jgi:hypothetical protein
MGIRLQSIEKGNKKMKLFKATTMVGCLALFGAVLTPNAMADEWNKKTVVTFSGPVEIPGVHLKGWSVLPAGTYVFKLLNSESDRHIVQIFSQDEKTVYATILAIPDYRMNPTDKTVITFSERPAGEPEALRTWFYPGSNYGDEFVYPKARAMEIAKTTNMPVLFTPVEIAVEVAEPIKTADAPVVVEMKQAPVMAVQPTGEQVQLAAVVTPPPAEMPAVATTQAPVADTLPATGSTMPLIGLMGLIALGGALSLRMIEKRVR